MIALRRRGAKRAHAPHIDPQTNDDVEDYSARLDALLAYTHTREQAEGMLKILEHVVAATMAAHERGNLLVSTDVTIRLWRDGGDLLTIGPNGEAIGSLTVRWQA